MPDEYVGAIIAAAIDIGGAFAIENGGRAEEAFSSEYSTDTTPLVFVSGNSSDEYYISSECQNIGGGACNTGFTQDIYGNSVMLINIVSLCCYASSIRNNIVHELGHLFNNIHGGNPASFAGKYAADRAKILRPFDGTQWQFNTYYNPNDPGRTNSEMYGDMFVAWVYDSWYTSPVNPFAEAARNARDDMNVNMTTWLP